MISRSKMRLLWLIIIMFSWVLVGSAQFAHQSSHENEADQLCDADGCTEKRTDPYIVIRTSRHECSAGHHPFQQCTITNTMLDKGEKTFKAYQAPEVNELEISKTWSIISTDDPLTCDKTFKHGFVFLFYYYKGSSNYFHLHYDTLIPLYYLLRDHMTHGYLSDEVLLMPSVETSRLKAIDWETTAFSYPSHEQPLWMQMLSVFGPDSAFLPLSSAVWEMENAVWGSEQKRICFDHLHLGVPNVDYSSSYFITSYVEYVKQQLGLENVALPTAPRLGIISRKNRRRIVNDNQLVEVSSHAIQSELIEYSGMSFREQVRQTQNFTIIAGMNGAGLTNCLFLPTGAVAIQLVPFNATNLNFKRFGTLLKSRGHYLEWHATDPDSSIQGTADSFENADTIVNSDEFVGLLFQALIVGINKELIE